MDFDALYLRVLKYLNFRPRSEKEIRDYLKKILSRHSERSEEYILRSTQDDNVADLIIHKLKKQRFLNDLEFAKMWIRSRTEFKPKGERLIRLELKQKGISKDLIDEALLSFDEDQKTHSGESRDDKVLAKEILEKRKKKYESMDRQERFNKAGSMLARRGFDLDDIKWAIDQVFGKMV
ncbi:MAG TPA: RecX family transcriptional regulator [Candidatus Eisenbacteria bacterium]|nr:RecX family transcriptional regulator [Candidatus Eisenbacteria bacterium]